MPTLQSNDAPQNTNGRPRRPNGAGSIQKLGARGGAKSKKSSSCKWRAQYTDYLSPKIPKPRPSRQFRTYRQAEVWLNERLDEQSRGFSSVALSSKMTISEFIEKFVENRELKGRSSETIRSYRSNLKNQIAPRIGHLNASKISPHAIESLFTQMHANGHQRAAELSYSLLRAAFKYAVKMGDLAHNPMQRIEKPKYHHEPSTEIPLEDLAKIYKVAMQDPYQHARLETGGLIGPRPSEILGLKWSDFDLDSPNPTLTISRKLQRVKGEGLVFGPIKTKKQIVKWLSAEQVRIFRIHKASQGLQKAAWRQDMDLVFPNSIGLPKDDKADTRDWKILCEKAGVKRYQRYQLRKSAFSYMAPGTDIKTLQQYSGINQISTLLNHYVHPLSSSKQKLLDDQDSLRNYLQNYQEKTNDEQKQTNPNISKSI